MTEKELKLLLARYNRGLASSQEKDLLERWYHQEFKIRRLNKELRNIDMFNVDNLKNEMWQGTLRKSQLTKQRKVGKLPRMFAIAAAVTLLLSIGIYLYRVSDKPAGTYTVAELADPAVDIKPGRNQATLTLADGRVIDLRDDKEGIVINTSSLTYSDGTEI